MIGAKNRIFDSVLINGCSNKMRTGRYPGCKKTKKMWFCSHYSADWEGGICFGSFNLILFVFRISASM
ncbi:MAG: hypothetical protein RLN85_18545, partial [Pseudomonadales bacterium]